MKRKLRNWAIGSLLALLTFFTLVYFLMDIAVEQVLKQLAPNVTVTEFTDDHEQKPAPSDKQTQNQINEEQTGSKSATKQSETRKDEPSFEYRAEISADRSANVENEITFNEKLLITSIMLGSFSTDEIGWIRKMAAGGLSIEEKKEMRNLFLKKLSPKQYNQLIEVAQKYGMSQGKKYEEHKQ